MDVLDAHETDRLRPASSEGPDRALHSFNSEMLTFSHIRRSSTPLEELHRWVVLRCSR
jgi:hypothetical protein